MPSGMNNADNINKTNVAAANAATYGTMIAPVVVSAVGRLKEAVHIKKIRGVSTFFGFGKKEQSFPLQL